MRHLQRLFNGITSGSRGALAEAITLVESTHEKKRRDGRQLLHSLLTHHQQHAKIAKFDTLTYRIGLTGPPGAGKSTFVDAFGSFLTERGHKVAVLAVDPSSKARGGSLLGDKTRMPRLATNKNAYIRPSPSKGTLGGITRSTSEAIVLCEAAEYDIIIVETVGVGQSETAVADLVDIFCLLIPPASGDELQGIKKGIVELADLVIVNKADGDLLPAARRIHMEYSSALRLLHRTGESTQSSWKPQVIRVSSKTGHNVDKLWEVIEDYKSQSIESGHWSRHREHQLLRAMWHHIEHSILEIFRNNPSLRDEIPIVEHQVRQGNLMSYEGAERLLKMFNDSMNFSSGSFNR